MWGLALVLDRIREPTPPPYGRLTVDDLQKHAVDIDFFLRNVAEKINDMSLLNHAKDVIKKSYGEVVSFSEKGKDLLKFGRNPNVGSSRSTIWYTGQDQANEMYVADNVNSIDTISSNNVADTEVVELQGHTMSGGNLTFVVQTATLNGQNKVTLTTPLNRCTRIKHAQQSAVDLVGEIYAYEDTAIIAGKPTDTTKIHLTVPAGENQSQKASTSLSSTDYWVISSITASLLQKSGSNVAEVRLETREIGGVFTPFTEPIAVKTGDSKEIIFEPYLIIKKNTDVRLTAIASASGQNVSGGINGFLAKVV